MPPHLNPAGHATRAGYGRRTWAGLWYLLACVPLAALGPARLHRRLAGALLGLAVPDPPPFRPARGLGAGSIDATITGDGDAVLLHVVLAVLRYLGS